MHSNLFNFFSGALRRFIYRREQRRESTGCDFYPALSGEHATRLLKGNLCNAFDDHPE